MKSSVNFSIQKNKPTNLIIALELLLVLTIMPYSLSGQTEKKRVYDGYAIENIAFLSLPGVYVTGSLYYPLIYTGTLPGILSFHGHWNSPEEYGRFREDAQKRCATLARMGTMVLSVDMVGYGEKRGWGWEHRHPEVLRLQLWNSIRAVDFMLSLDDIDPGRIAVTCGGDWTKNTPWVEYPHVRSIYDLYGKKENVMNLHFPEENHGYEFSIRKAVYPFLARHLNLGIYAIIDQYGNISEEDAVIEPYEELVVFKAEVPVPNDAIRSNDLMVWPETTP